ncbi:MAG: S-layer homology domain-containing protein, partial [Syntrophomonadaceae bacterium]|nr:S-layer homology domain-containing protein [Syntrophomonadaceae bacterium]
PYPVRVMEGVTAVDAGGSHMLAIKSDSSLWAWGGGVNAPGRVLEGVNAVSAGQNHRLAVKTDGSLWAWGNNDKGQLGTGDLSASSTPIKVMDETAAVAAGGSHSLALKRDGSLWAWGDNERGQVGNGHVGDKTNNYGDPVQSVPVRIMDNVTAISAGQDFSLALTADGVLWAWGSNEWGQAGNDRQGDALDVYGNPIRTAPASIMTGIAAMDAGMYHTLALTAGGELFAWGGNSDGELGNGSIGYSYAPARVLQDVMASSLSGSLAGSGLVSTQDMVYAADMYDYPEVMADQAAEKTAAMKKLSDERLVGELTGIFQLTEELYCAVTTIDSRVTGCAVIKELRADGEPAFRVVQAVNGMLNAAGLEKCIDEAAATPNLIIDYDRSAGFISGSQYVTYLEELLNNMDGVTPNDPAKSALATYVESAISGASRAAVTAANNQVTVSGADIHAAIDSAAHTRLELEALLADYGVALNKVLESVIVISVNRIDNTRSMQVTLAQDVAASMGQAGGLKLILGDTRHTVSADTAALSTVLASGPGIVQITPLAVNKFDITFVDGMNNAIEQIPAPISFALPAASSLDSVFATYKGGSDNWGGQFDQTAQTLEFATNFSGSYEVVSSDIMADDIQGLSDEMRSSITFMLSKGYLELTDGAFRPHDPLTRYDFTAALVKMFFALNRGLICSFSDVSDDSPYYNFVASAEAANIAQGYDDSTFRGEDQISAEQVVALCARTLADKQGYLYPAAPEEYLNFDDGNAISDWAREAVALAVREGLIEGSGNLEPQSSIGRGESAMLLYNLFMLLYETTPVTYMADATPPEESGGAPEEGPETPEQAWLPTALPLIIGGALLLGIAALIMVRKRS